MKLIKILLTFLIFGILIGGFFHKINAITQDLGRHLLTGEIIVKTQNIPKTNLFSYTYPNFPFINHHWFSEVIYYFIYSLSGFNGLLIFSILMVIAAFSLIFFYSLKHLNDASLNNIAIVTIASLLYFGVLFERTDLRPEIFSFLFLSIFIIILYSYRQKFTKWIFILPLIELLWVNTHIYFPIGIIVIGLFLIDSLTPKFRNKTILILSLVLFLSILVTLLNPNGLSGALYPFKVFQNYGYTIEENQNIFFLWQLFQKPTIVFFTISALLLFTTLFATIKKTRLIDWLLAVFFTIFAIFAIRNFPLFVFATFIPFVKSLSNSERLLASSSTRRSVLRHFISRNDKENGSRITIIFIFFSIVILWQIMEITKTKTFGFGVEKGASDATDFFIKNNLKGPIFNNFDIGSYLEYKLYPKEKVFVDGRPEAYPDNFFKETYMLMQDNKDVFDKISLNYKFNTVFFAHTDQTSWASNFLRQIINNNNWKMIYLDNYVVIFVKDNQKNQKLIKNFFITQNSFKISLFLNNDLYALFRYASFFQKTGWVEKEVEAYQKMLSINPNFCPALYNLSLALNQKGDPTYTIFLQKFQLRCK